MRDEQDFDLTRAVSNPFTGRELLVFAIFNVVLSQLSGLFGQLLDASLLNILSAVGVLALMSAFGYLSRKREKERQQQLRSVTFQPRKDDRPGKTRGMILLISPYDPRDRAIASSDAFRQALEKILSSGNQKLPVEEFNNINLPSSNLAPQLKAVEYHATQSALKELWLIATNSVTGKDGKPTGGSEGAATILTKYLNMKFPSLVIHPPVRVDDWDYKAIWESVEEIYRTADYKDELLVADITGGNKIMSVATALACIPPKRRLQYIYSQRDSFGRPLEGGQIDPILIDVDPILYGAQKQVR